MSDTPRTDAADLYDYQTAVEVCGELERELANEELTLRNGAKRNGGSVQ